MKSHRREFEPIGREQLLQELVHDSYKAGRKLKCKCTTDYRLH